MYRQKLMFRGMCLILMIVFRFGNINGQNLNKKNHFTKICLALGGCIGDCPRIAIEIDTTLTYRFYGDNESSKSGCYIGTLTQGYWDSLNFRLEKFKNQSMEKPNPTAFAEYQSYEIVMFYDTTAKHSVIFEHNFVRDAYLLFHQLAISYKSMNLTKVPDCPFNFETTIQGEIKRTIINSKSSKTKLPRSKTK